MRVKSEIWVKAYLRRATSEGALGVVVHRGDDDAGIILIKIRRPDGICDLFGPAPAGYASGDGERRWMSLAEKVIEAEVDARISSELRLDSDAWIVELEDRGGRNFLDDWLVSDPSAF